MNSWFQTYAAAVVHVHNGHYSATRKDGIGPCMTMWMDPETTMHSEMSQTEERTM